MEHLSGFAPLAERYNGFVLDLWGVIHDGINAFPHAVDCLRRLRNGENARCCCPMCRGRTTRCGP